MKFPPAYEGCYNTPRLYVDKFPLSNYRGLAESKQRVLICEAHMNGRIRHFEEWCARRGNLTECKRCMRLEVGQMIDTGMKISLK
jgi:hypothetical protein